MPDNGFIESFNGRLRDELLNETLFTSLAQARVAIALWRADYTTPRGRIPKSPGRHRPSSPLPSICDGRSRVRELDPLPPGAREPLSEWIDDCANALVEAIIAITSVIDIEAIVLDSILPRPIHLELLAKVQTQFNRISAIGIVAPEIVSGQFGPEASPIGAAMLPFSALLAPDSGVLMIGKDRTMLLGSLSRLASQGQPARSSAPSTA